MQRNGKKSRSGKEGRIIMDELEQKLTEWFSEAHNLQDTFDHFKDYPNVTRKVIDMERSGFIYAYPTKSGIDMYVRAVRALPELDIGV